MFIRIAAALTFSAAFVTAASPAAQADDQPVKLKTLDDGRIEVHLGDEHFTTFIPNTEGKAPKPYFYPVNGPGGALLSRPIGRKGDDHPHHKGIWVAVDEVNGVKFWAERGKITTEKVQSTTAGGNGVITVTNHWRNPAGGTEVVEETKITIHPNRLLDYEITFKAEKKPVEFHDTKEGLFGFRMVNSMRERDGGQVVDSQDRKGSKESWGKTAEWIDYTGEVDGKTFGVAIFDHPKNFRKSRYHVRNYGLFSINPFGEKSYARNTVEPTRLAPGKSLTLRYAMYFHAGETKEAKVQDVYKEWAESTGK